VQAASDLDALHAIFVPVGGGGLIAGIAAYVKALKPGIKVIGVEPTGERAVGNSCGAAVRLLLSASCAESPKMVASLWALHAELHRW
jgi:threonine dehydratase